MIDGMILLVIVLGIIAVVTVITSHFEANIDYREPEFTVRRTNQN